MEVKVCPSGVRKITYNVPSSGKKFAEALFKNVMEFPMQRSKFFSRKWTSMVSLFSQI